MYTALTAKSFDRNVKRRLDVKIVATKRPQLADSLIKLLSFSANQQRARDRIEDLYRMHSQEPIVIYLKARHLFNQGRRLRAASLLTNLDAQTLPPSVWLEVSRLKASLSFKSHCYQLAKKGFEQYVTEFGEQLTAGERENFNEWRRRSEFFSRSETLKHLACPLEIDNLYIHPHDDEKRE